MAFETVAAVCELLVVPLLDVAPLPALDDDDEFVAEPDEVVPELLVAEPPLVVVVVLPELDDVPLEVELVVGVVGAVPGPKIGMMLMTVPR